MTLKRGGRIHYEVNLKHVVAELGNKPLREVKHEDAQLRCAGMLHKTYSVGAAGRKVRYSVQPRCTCEKSSAPFWSMPRR
jgi:hypothetical protein